MRKAPTLQFRVLGDPNASARTQYAPLLPRGASVGAPLEDDKAVTEAQQKIKEALKDILRARYSMLQRTLGVKKIEAEHISSLDYQIVTKGYNDALSSVQSYVSDSLEASRMAPKPGTNKPPGKVGRSVLTFVLLVVALSLAMVGLAVLFAYLGGQESPLVASLSASGFFGWPQNLNGFMTLKNLFGGLMLGLVFGFLDNFGLFFGMQSLDPFFFREASAIIAGMVYSLRSDELDEQQNWPSLQREERLLEVNEVTNDLMAGLGNTFSDLVGVLVGTAALEIAKAGLAINPQFWPLDVVAMLIGCLLGAFLPALSKHSETIGGKNNASMLNTMAWSTMGMIFLAVVFAGLPEKKNTEASDWSFWVSLVFILIPVLVLVRLMLYGRVGGKKMVFWRSSFYELMMGFAEKKQVP